ncbi:hypothetical protein pb186bvf_015337 [Paramecium bursaria]
MFQFFQFDKQKQKQKVDRISKAILRDQKDDIKELIPVRFFIMEKLDQQKEDHKNQQSKSYENFCLELDIKKQQIIKVKDIQSKDFNLDYMIENQRKQIQQQREQIIKYLDSQPIQLKQINELRDLKEYKEKQLDDLKIQYLKIKCKNELIRRQIFLQQVNFHKQVDFAFNLA